VKEAVAVVGGGAMGVGIAYVFAAAGHATMVVEPDALRVATIRRTFTDVAADGVRRGKLTTQEALDIPSSITIVSNTAELPADLALVIESVPEQLALKAQVMHGIDARSPRLIATNTSALSISRLSAEVSDPSRFLGMHFFNPVWSLPMVEIVRGTLTAESAVHDALAFVSSLRKEPIVVRDSPGFVTSRLDLIASLEAMRMLQDGIASAADIDRAMVIAYRHPVGPLHLSDIVGLDVRLDISRNLALELGERYAPPQILIDLVDAGYLGVKSGRGFFEYPSQTEDPT
jgi:3-hydroxybutyryl-CoA dehydrogenase